MPADAQFWWNWGLNLVIAAATLAAVIVALFGEKIKSWMFHPKLRLSLRSSHGELTVATLSWTDQSGDTYSRQVPARYYHLIVSNEVKWPTATRVRVYIREYQVRGPDGNLQTKWTGELPIIWMHQEIHPTEQSVGKPVFADLLSIIKEKGIGLHPQLVPNNFPQRLESAGSFAVVVQAQGVESSSPAYRVEVSWNGEWVDGDAEMAKNLIVKMSQIGS